MRNMNKEVAIKVIKFFGVVLLGIVYVKLINIFMAQIYKFTGDLITNFEKIAFVASAVLLSTVIVFLVNSFLLKGNKKHLGYWCALFAFIYFYVVRAENGTLILLFQVFLFLHSAFAFVMFIFIPIFAGSKIMVRITNRLTSPINSMGRTREKTRAR